MHEETNLTKNECLPQTKSQIYSYGKREAISITQRLLNRYSAAATCTLKIVQAQSRKIRG